MATGNRKPRLSRVKLNREELYEEYFEYMECAAIVSTLPYYQFAHWLNVHLDRNMRLDSELAVVIDRKEDALEGAKELRFMVLYDNDPIRNIEYHLICNRNRTDFLISELKNTDYILLMNGIKQYNGLFHEQFEKLGQISKVSYVYSFNPFQIKSKDYLIL